MLKPKCVALNFATVNQLEELSSTLTLENDRFLGSESQPKRA